jgi:hypothetical protein
LKIGDASKVAPVDKFSVVLVALFAVVVLGERPSLREWAGIAMVGAGVVVLALKCAVLPWRRGFLEIGGTMSRGDGIPPLTAAPAADDAYAVRPCVESQRDSN